MTDKALAGVIERFKNLLSIQIDLQHETISADFTEYELKQIIFFLGELKALKEMAESQLTLKPSDEASKFNRMMEAAEAWSK